MSSTVSFDLNTLYGNAMMSSLPQKILFKDRDSIMFELLKRTEDTKVHLNSLTDVREKFLGMTKEELINELVCTQDKLTQTSAELKDKKDAFRRACEGVVERNKVYLDTCEVLWKLGYVECDKCGTWKKVKK